MLALGSCCDERGGATATTVAVHNIAALWMGAPRAVHDHVCARDEYIGSIVCAVAGGDSSARCTVLWPLYICNALRVVQVADMEQTMESVMQGNSALEARVKELETQLETTQESLTKSEARLAEAMKRVRRKRHIAVSVAWLLAVV